MMRSYSTITLAASLATAILCAPAIGADKIPQAEIQHWWSSEGEAKALQVFIDTFDSRGGHYFNSSMQNQSLLREEAIDRMSKGYPATFTQWNAGKDIKDFYDYGLTRSIDDPVILKHMRSSLPEAIMNAITYRDQVIAVPLNIHSENWMWHSTTLLPSDSALLAGEWSRLLEEGEALAEDEIPLLAVGDQPWQIRILFSSVLLGISRDTFNDLYAKKSDAAAQSMELETALRVFYQLAEYSHSFGNGNWDEQVTAVAENKAAANFMGDWAKGAFASLGQSPGKEYGCSLTGGADPSVLMVIDTLILGKVKDEADIKGQELMLEVVTDPETNLAFNLLKGSISPYAATPAKDLDVCSNQVSNALRNPDALITPYGFYAEENNFIHKLNGATHNFWKQAIAGEDRESLIASTLSDIADLLAKRSEWARQTLNESQDE